MDNEDALGHLLKVEAEAASLVSDAIAEADKRIAEAEKNNRAKYEEKYHMELEKFESEFNLEKERIKDQYQKAMEAHNQLLSGMSTDMKRFSLLFNEHFSGEG
jgi:vacuolar-type H+-ATPase subunit H